MTPDRADRPARARRRPPVALALPAAVGALLLLTPLVAMVVLAPWRDLPALLARPAVLDALRLSLVTASVSTLLCLAMGVPLAWVLARADAHPGGSTGPARAAAVRLLRAVVTLPMVLPPVVGGVALLLAYGRTGLVGRWLYEATGWQVPFTATAVVLAQTFVALPFLVVTVEGALRSTGTALEEAAATLGAGPLTTFRRVTLPALGPSIAAGAVLGWARALGEFGATVTFAGNLPGVTQTMPSAVYRAFETDPPAAVALSLVLLAVCVTVLVLLRDRWTPGLPR